jgi:naphthoate synthase
VLIGEGTMELNEILYEKSEGIAKITINRPEKYNAFTIRTLHEMIDALEDAGFDKSVGVVVLTGAGDKAFCTGGDQYTRQKGGYEEKGGLDMIRAHNRIIYLIRNIPKPVIAAVKGYAIGGGHVLHVVCDMTIASSTSRFGQTGPRVGSYDAGFGTAYLARVVGEKRAREIWYLCRQYTAEEAYQMGLVNKVVPPEDLEQEVEDVCRELLVKSPTALAVLKASFNADTEGISGIHNIAGYSLEQFYNAEESMEGRNAFLEKRPPDFSRFRK